MSDVTAYLKRAAERTRHVREYYVEKNVPTQPSNIQAITFYGDLPSTFILSAYLLKHYKELHKNKYLILSSWPGFQGLFPYVDEYWSIRDESVVKSLALEANSFYNTASIATDLSRGLLECFDTWTHRDIRRWYSKGFTDEYWTLFKEVKRFLPEVSSETRITEGFRLQLSRKEGRKIVVCPVTRMRSWQRGTSVYLPISKTFWAALLEYLLEHGFTPVVWQNPFTYDMSIDFVERCVYLVSRTVVDVIAAMRHIGLVLDVHSGISRIATAARCPYVAIDERQRYMEEQEYAIDDLSCGSLPRKYLFSYATMLMAGGKEDWQISLFNTLLNCLNSFDPKGDWGSTHESYDLVPYSKVRERKFKKMGIHFIKASKEKQECRISHE